MGLRCATPVPKTALPPPSKFHQIRCECFGSLQNSPLTAPPLLSSLSALYSSKQLRKWGVLTWIGVVQIFLDELVVLASLSVRREVTPKLQMGREANAALAVGANSGLLDAKIESII